MTTSEARCLRIWQGSASLVTALRVVNPGLSDSQLPYMSQFEIITRIITL